MNIIFFDIDGTLTSEVDGSIPESAVCAIRKARENGNKLFINTGRCLQNVEKRFKDVGWDGYVCGCGTDVYCEGKNLAYAGLERSVCEKIIKAARETGVDIVFECRDFVTFDFTRALKCEGALAQLGKFVERGYDFRKDYESPDFTFDKFCIWYEKEEERDNFRKVSDEYFECVQREGKFCEFIPKGYSKAGGMEIIKNYYAGKVEPGETVTTYAFGDSGNDLAMLAAADRTVVMGNAFPEKLKEMADFVADRASRDGVYKAMLALKLI